MIETVKPLEHGALEDNTNRPDGQRHEHERGPVIDAEISEPHPGEERAHHVLRAVREIDDVEQPEDNRQTEREDGVERTVDEPDQQLREQTLNGYSENFGHG